MNDQAMTNLFASLAKSLEEARRAYESASFVSTMFNLLTEVTSPSDRKGHWEAYCTADLDYNSYYLLKNNGEACLAKWAGRWEVIYPYQKELPYSSLGEFGYIWIKRHQDYDRTKVIEDRLTAMESRQEYEDFRKGEGS